MDPLIIRQIKASRGFHTGATEYLNRVSEIVVNDDVEGTSLGRIAGALWDAADGQQKALEELTNAVAILARLIVPLAESGRSLPGLDVADVAEMIALAQGLRDADSVRPGQLQLRNELLKNADRLARLVLKALGV